MNKTNYLHFYAYRQKGARLPCNPSRRSALQPFAHATCMLLHGHLRSSASLSSFSR